MSRRKYFSFSEGGSRSVPSSCFVTAAPLSPISLSGNDMSSFPVLLFRRLLLANPVKLFSRSSSTALIPISNMTSSINPSLIKARPHASNGVNAITVVTGLPFSSFRHTLPSVSTSGSVPIQRSKSGESRGRKEKLRIDFYTRTWHNKFDIRIWKRSRCFQRAIVVSN